MAVALGRVGFGRGARHCGRAGWNDHRGVGRVAGDGAVNWLAIVCAISKHRGDRAVDLVEQRADQGHVAVVRRGQFRGEDLAVVRIDHQVKLPPAPARLAAVLLVQPISGPEHLQPRAVDHHVDRAARLPQGGRDTQVGAAAREGRMVRHRQIQVEQVHDGTQHARGLTPGSTKRQPQHQPRFNGDVRISPGPSPPPGRRRQPDCDGFRRHPDRQAASPPQRRVVLCPILDFVPGLRDFVTARFIRLVRHQGPRGQWVASIPNRLPQRQPPMAIFAPRPLSAGNALTFSRETPKSARE